MATAIQHQIRAGYGFMERNVNLVKRYWAWEIVWMVYSIANSLSVSYIGLGMEVIAGASANVDGRVLVLYLVIGTLVWRYLSIIFIWITELISIERWEGTIEYTLMAPIRRITHMTGQTVFAVLYSLLFTAVVLLVTVLLFEIDMSQANLFGGTVMLIAGSFSFIGISIMASVLPLIFPERGSQMTHIVIAVMLLVSGVYYPVSVLPVALQTLAVFSPATYVLDGVRLALLEGANTLVLWPQIWPLLIMGVVAVPLGLWVFNQAERYAKRAGKLARNG
ncbi:MAG: ABC transporter permease [Chloroflexi bacterium]|nr:MAG: ABC transporter permease [Chloroflexota bacterium]MBL1195248.1 ABC transporter permease [Chloroflexota bacterium]NOH12534.1 ABC transporter permease [Chloroflexota bacterium]